jgi:anti-anti-sigma regulatory factor
MLRISENSENCRTIRVRLDGTIDKNTYPELEEVRGHHLGVDERVVLLDMAGVTYMTEEVAHKLARLRSERLQIINCSPFIEALLNAAKN